MKKYFIALVILAYAGQAQGQQTPEQNAVTFVSEQLKAGTHKFQVLVRDFTEDYMKLSQKYTASLADKQEWFSGYKKEHAGTVPLPYHQNFGLTKAEYDRMMKEDLNPKMKVKTERNLEVIRSGDTLRLRGGKTFPIFDAFSFDLKNALALVDNEKMDFKGDAHNVQGDVSLGSWSGYRWVQELGAINDPAGYSMLDLSIATTTDKKVLLFFKGLIYEDGRTKANGAVLGYLID